jgi:hypothetical protein
MAALGGGRAGLLAPDLEGVVVLNNPFQRLALFQIQGRG